MKRSNQRALALFLSATTPALAQHLDEKCTAGEVNANGLVCVPATTPSDLYEFELDPAYVLNARKGDSLISSGCGIIGTLMTNVRPNQYYDHTGIMIEDGYAIRHSTASVGRLKANMVGFTQDGSDGFDPDTLRFAWPGTISQTTHHAFEGEYLTDPLGAQYKLGSFSDQADSDCATQIAPSVVKPPADSELDDPNVRAQLHAAADAAQGIDGHYRFYGYTDGTAFEVAPDTAGWAAGSIPTVCSSFVRTAMKTAGVHLEGRLEASDCTLVDGFPRGEVSLGEDCQAGQSLPAEFDGLYMYTLAERTDAAHWLHGALYDMAYEEAGGLGVFLTDAADDTADQLTNCFAFDWCGLASDGGQDIDGNTDIEACQNDEEDAKDSSCWEGPPILLDGEVGFDEVVFNISKCTGAEVRAEITVRAKRDPVQGVLSKVDVKLFEGTACDTTDLDVSTSFPWQVLPDGELHFGQSVENDEFNSPDRIELDLVLRNQAFEE